MSKTMPPSLMAHVSTTFLNADRDGRVYKSDCDEQVIVHFECKPNEAAHVHAVVLTAPRGEGIAVPNSVQIFLNARSLSFASLDNFRPVDTVPLVWTPVDDSTQSAVAMLKTAPLQNAFQISVFMPDNTSGGEDDVTIFGTVDIHGEMAGGLGTTALPQKG